MAFVTAHTRIATLFFLGWYAQASRAVDVTLVVENVQMALSVQHRFADAERELPAAGRLPIDSSRDAKHGAVTYCYSFEIPSGLGQLEMYDSDFGMHTARIFRAAKGGARCPLLRSVPYIVVGDEEYSLLGTDWSAPRGFESKREGDIETFTREWTYHDPARGTCFSRSIAVTVERTAGTVTDGTVQNWEEPGC